MRATGAYQPATKDVTGTFEDRRYDAYRGGPNALVARTRRQGGHGPPVRESAKRVSMRGLESGRGGADVGQGRARARRAQPLNPNQHARRVDVVALDKGPPNTVDRMCEENEGVGCGRSTTRARSNFAATPDCVTVAG